LIDRAASTKLCLLESFIVKSLFGLGFSELFLFFSLETFAKGSNPFFVICVVFVVFVCDGLEATLIFKKFLSSSLALLIFEFK